MPSLEALLLGTKRTIEPTDLAGNLTGEAIIPDVTIAEMHSDEVAVTSHPVDVGAQISDHAYRQPAMLVCTFGWSDSSRLVNAAFNGSLFKGMDSINDVYDKLLRLMNARQPLKVSTSKRVYESMIITGLQTTTTVDTENSAIIEVTFQEIIVAKAKEVALASIKQANPSLTASLKNLGTKNVTVAQKTLTQGALQ